MELHNLESNCSPPMNNSKIISDLCQKAEAFLEKNEQSAKHKFIQDASTLVSAGRKYKLLHLESFCHLMLRLGTVHHLLGNYITSEKILLETLKNAKANGYIVIEGHAMDSLSVGYFCRGQYQKTIDTGEEAIKILSQLDCPEKLAAPLCNIASSYFELGQYHRAADTYYKSLKITKAYKKDLLTAVISYNIIHCLIVQKRYDLALDELQKFEKFTDECERDLTIYLYNAYCEYYFKTQNRTKLPEYAEKFLLLSQKQEQLLPKFQAHLYQARAKIGCKQFKEAFDHALYLYQYAKDNESDSQLFLAYHTIGQILYRVIDNQAYYWNHTDLLNEFDGQLLLLLKETEVIANIIDCTQEKLCIYRLLEKYYNHQKEFEQAYSYAKKCQEIEKEIYNIEKNDLVFRLQEEFHTQQKEQEIVFQKQLLTQQKEITAKLENFAHTTSHDLREPLQSISSFVKLIRNHGDHLSDKDRNEFLDYIQYSSDRLIRMVKDLLQYSKLGQNLPEAEPIALEQILKDVKLNLHNQIERENAILKMKGELPLLEGHQALIHQLFQNLISNALKFSQEGIQPIISVEIQTVDFQTIYKVEDNGIGMEEDKLERIFRPFTRLHNQEKYEGSGIGLATCKKIVELYRGTIWAESKVNEGTCFYLTLPDVPAYFSETNTQ